jgi:hypothetical protein
VRGTEQATSWWKTQTRNFHPIAFDLELQISPVLQLAPHRGDTNRRALPGPLLPDDASLEALSPWSKLKLSTVPHAEHVECRALPLWYRFAGHREGTADVVFYLSI